MNLPGDPNLPGGMTQASFDRYFPEQPEDCQACNGTGRLCAGCGKIVGKNAEHCPACHGDEICDCPECEGRGHEKSREQIRREYEEDKADRDR